MIQIQSSWFPLYDRNPQKFMNIYDAEDNDFQKAKIKIYHSKEYPSGIRFGRLPEWDAAWFYHRGTQMIFTEDRKVFGGLLLK